MNYTKYKGIIHGLSKEDNRRFFMSLAFFLPKGDLSLSASALLKLPKTKLGDAYWNTLNRADSDFMKLLNAIDLKTSSLSVYWGEPKEDLEFFLEDLEDDLNENNLQSFGYLLIHHSDFLGDEEDTTEIKYTPQVASLLQYLEKHYLEVET